MDAWSAWQQRNSCPAWLTDTCRCTIILAPGIMLEMNGLIACAQQLALCALGRRG